MSSFKFFQDIYRMFIKISLGNDKCYLEFKPSDQMLWERVQEIKHISKEDLVNDPALLDEYRCNIIKKKIRQYMISEFLKIPTTGDLLELVAKLSTTEATTEYDILNIEGYDRLFERMAASRK